MTFIFLALAAISGAAFHFSFRRSMDGGGRANVFLFLQCFMAFIATTLINVNQDNFHKFDLTTITVGSLEGVIYVAMMWVLALAFKKGPAGLTVATMNSASVIPAIMMAIIFGSSFGHGYTLANGLGSLLVVAGLFMAASAKTFAGQLKQWAFFALLAFLGHSFYLSLMQWRALILKLGDLPYLFFDMPLESAHWFQSMIFLVAALIYGAIYFVTDRRAFQKSELLWASLGGIANALCTFGLVYASEIAGEREKAMIFPISGVVSILLCNLWGKWYYKERVNWKALSVCLSGLVIGTVAWQ